MGRTFKDNVAFLVMVLSTFAGALVYGEMRLESIEKQARSDIERQNDGIENKLHNETQQRREDIREVNQKLDRILALLTRLPR